MIVKRFPFPKVGLQKYFKSPSFKPLIWSQTNYLMSGRKTPLKKQKSFQPVTSSSSSLKKIDIQSLPTNQKIRVLKEDILQSIKLKEDSDRFMQVLQFFSNVFVSQQRFKDGMIEFHNIVKLLQATPAFKHSPNLHFSYTELRFFLVRLGKIDDAIIINQKCCNLLKNKGEKDGLHLGNQMSTLAILNFMKKDFSQARKALEAELKINDTACDQNFIQMIECKNNLAILDFMQGKYDSAFKKLEKNAEISKGIMKASKKQIQKLYAKHFVYLEAIYEMKISKTEDKSSQNDLNSKLFDCLEHIKEIVAKSDIINTDFHLYYETIAEHFLVTGNNQLCIKFIKKAISINEKKLLQPLVKGKSAKTVFQVQNNIAKQHKILASAHQNSSQYQQAFQNYIQSMDIYKKSILSNDAKQLTSIIVIQDFIECCRCLFRLRFIMEPNRQKAFEEGLQFIETPLLIWNDMVRNVWNLPQHFTFIPYQLNIDIGIKLLEFGLTDNALQYFSVCISEIENNKQLLCPKSKKSFKNQSEQISSLLQKFSSTKKLASLKEIVLKLNKFSN